MTFRVFLAKQKKPASVAKLLRSMPNVKSWAEVRKFLNSCEAEEAHFVAVRAMWRKFMEKRRSVNG